MRPRLVRIGVFLLLCQVGSANPANSPGISLDVPFIRQEKDGCGAASIAMVMQYWALQRGTAIPANSDPKTIQQALYAREARGIYASAMIRYFRESGFRTFAFKGEQSDLKDHLSKGRPLIVSLQPGARGAPLHYVVVAGMDWKQGLVLLNDPARRKLISVPQSEFDKEWNAAGNWTLLAVPTQHQ
jgi:predicted double-glycine peptidase